ncbi:asparaginase domain-containing protein [Pseudomonas entomophila]|uniref:asparaginase domain-containing protein n=1 Tax=Pseudomonas entomophila TaxID=312306 RepID=UPI0023D83BC6|nr:asparaginase domain-containing protein [Pseudomonas entomophila]MDF0733457.1 asparaginase domain-containing protein [Pseudomonas entomophila]
MKIAVINTGGTISCVGNPLAPMTAAQFASASQQLIDPILRQQFSDLQVDYLTSVTFPESSTQTLDSTNLQPSDWCIMAKGILDNYAAYDGFVVLHGTDSMDFTGTALAFLLNSFDSQGVGTALLSKPVIITGSQVPLYYQASAGASLTLNFNTDAFQNVCGAVALAQSGLPEVGVYFQNHLYRGNRAVKTNASEFDAFHSPNYPTLAEYGVELTLHNANWLPGPVHASVSLDDASVLAAQQAALAAIDNYPVMQLNAFPAFYSQSPAKSFMADLINAVVAAGATGIILESYGEGNFPSGNPDTPTQGAIYQALDLANEQGVNIVDCTQVIAGTVNNSAYAAGAWLPQVGALAPADMTPMAALAKLMILMASANYRGWTRSQVQELFQTNLAGEMLSVNLLDSRANATLLPGQSIAALDGSAQLLNDPERGPVLSGAGTTTALWQLPSPPSASALPGRLVMQDDGNLVFYGRDNQALWASNTGNPAGASSRLVLTGRYVAATPAASTLKLQVLNYSANTIAVTLYPAV